METNPPNLYNVFIVFIQMMGPIVATIVTYLLTKKSTNEIKHSTNEIKHEAAKAVENAEAAVIETVKGNERIEEVRRTVNGKSDQLAAENARLLSEVRLLEAKLQGRRAEDAKAEL